MTTYTQEIEQSVVEFSILCSGGDPIQYYGATYVFVEPHILEKKSVWGGLNTLNKNKVVNLRKALRNNNVLFTSPNHLGKIST